MLTSSEIYCESCGKDISENVYFECRKCGVIFCGECEDVSEKYCVDCRETSQKELARKNGKWSANQERFMREAEEQGFEVDCTYSGRGMYGKMCPSVRVNCQGEFKTSASYNLDNMGLGFVMYARF